MKEGKYSQRQRMNAGFKEKTKGIFHIVTKVYNELQSATFTFMVTTESFSLLSVVLAFCCMRNCRGNKLLTFLQTPE